MAYSQTTASEIDRKLREDFRRRLREFGVQAETTDPVLAVLFRTLAGQIETFYNETGRIRLSLLDELIEGLGLERRMARPAQTLVRFHVSEGACVLDAGTELSAEAGSGERLTFSTDATIAVSPARIALAAVYQEGSLRLIPGVDMSEEAQQARPSLEPAPASAGPAPFVVIAIDGVPDAHLGLHAFCFELTPDARSIAAALESETWCIFGRDGQLRGEGVLRPKRANAGVRRLEWLVRTGESAAASGAEPLPELPDGFYAGRVFVFPPVPESRKTMCRAPRCLEPALGRLLQAGAARFFEHDRAWLRISMPPGTGPLVAGISNIWMHAVSASNVECLNQTVYFDRHGASIPVSREAGTRKFLVAPLSITGSRGGSYLPEFQPSPERDAGRYAIRNGHIHLTASRDAQDHDDEYANVRIWVTDGTLGNSIGPGQVTGFLRRAPVRGLELTNPASAAGATDGESYGDAQARFAQALLSRDRLVTHADLVTAIRCFDRRIRSVDCECGLARRNGALQRVQRITVRVSAGDFADPDLESRILTSELSAWLRDRFLYDLDLSMRLEWI